MPSAPAKLPWHARVRERFVQLSIRRQLWTLFGLFLLAGFSVLVIDEIAQHRARASLLQLKDDSLLRVRRLNAVSDGYGLGVVDTTFRVRNGLQSWSEGVSTIDAARERIDRHWDALQAMPRAPAQQKLFDEVRRARTDADAATARLRRILAERDAAELAVFADTTLYPAIDPVTTRIQALSDLAMVEADALVQADLERNRRISVLRIGLSLLTLLAVMLIGRSVLRNAYRGIESLSFLVRRMRAHDYTAQPRFQPRGELGTVMEGLVEMRRDVLAFETELTEQLARNETTRAELARSNRFQRSLLDAAQVAIFAIDARGAWTVFNPFAERLLGRRAEEMLGKVVRYGGAVQPHDSPLLLDPAQIESTCARLSARLGREVPRDWRALVELAELRQPPAEATLRHRDGHPIPVLLALSPFDDDQGERAGVIAVAADLSAIKQLQSELRDSEARAQAANHAKSAFLAAMSHEIRTPMIGVTGMVEVLAHTPLDPDQRRALNIIQHSSQTLLQIIGDILDFSKIEAGRLDLAPEPVRLPALVRSTVANYSGAASSKGLALECRIDERLAAAHVADPLRLRQILGNFLSNAIKFTDDGRVEVGLEWRGEVEPAGATTHGRERVRLQVRDSGIGVSAEAQAKLFEPFSQAEGDTTRRFGGTGLGLAICRRLAELMGGEVGMDSTVGEGTTLQLELVLPRARVDDVAVEAADATAPPRFAPRRLPATEQAVRERSLVLLVDDHPTNRMVIARQLALAGYASEVAEDGRQGLERWRSGRYALLLSDVHMPGLDGYQLAAAIRAEEARDHLPRTPIVALTASALKGEAERCIGAGMDDYLAKPVSVAALQACLQRWLPHTGDGGDNNDEPAIDAAAVPSPLQPQRPPALDDETLVVLTGGDRGEARLLLADFLASTAIDLVELDRAVADGDGDATARQAHKIKGAARLVGAGELAEAAAALEARTRDAPAAPANALAAHVHAAAARLRRYVAERYP